MQANSWLIDRKIMGINVGAELSIGEYIEFSEAILEKNEYQRKKVKSQGRTYDLLRRDMVEGCVIPPIILAVTEAYGEDLAEIIEDSVKNDRLENNKGKVEAYIKKAISDRELLILDGLQRTLTIQSICNSQETFEDEFSKKRFLDQPIRVEIYVGLSKTGILYRMLTLNTGQTPMSFRHQLEILYHDYINNADLPDGIEVFKEAEEKRARGIGKYKYQDVVDLFYSYSTGSAMSYDRQTLVSELKEINFLEKYSYTNNTDDMQNLLVLYNIFISKISKMSDNWHFDAGDVIGAEISRPFGKNVDSVFSRSQPMTGFGAECKRLVELEKVPSIEAIADIVDQISFEQSDPHEALNQLITILDDIAKTAKKIGDAQRIYFQYAFRSLFFEESDAYLRLDRCWLAAQEKYQMMY